MEQSELVDIIISKGAFIPDKLDRLHSEQTLDLGESIYQQHPGDISLATAGLYIARRTGLTPEHKKWASMVKELIGRLSRSGPKDPVEMNNMAFAYQYLGTYNDPGMPEFAVSLINHAYSIGWTTTIQPLYHKNPRKCPTPC